MCTKKNPSRYSIRVGHKASFCRYIAINVQGGRGKFWKGRKYIFVEKGVYSGKEEYILGAPHNIIVVEKGGIFWEGGLILAGSHISICWKRSVFWEGRGDYWRVAFSGWNGGGAFLDGGVDSERVAHIHLLKRGYILGRRSDSRCVA